jgi:hypothetical protein
MLWQSMAGMRFRMPEGYAFVPHSSTATALSPPASALQTVMVAIQTGQAAPAMTARLRHQLLDELSAWHVRTVIIGPMGNRTAMRLFFTRLLDHAAAWSGRVDVWWHAQTLPLHRGKPAALLKRPG